MILGLVTSEITTTIKQAILVIMIKNSSTAPARAGIATG
jgi:hypothetical protein